MTIAAYWYEEAKKDRRRVVELEAELAEQRDLIARTALIVDAQVTRTLEAVERAAVLKGERRIAALEAELEEATRALVRERIRMYEQQQRAEAAEARLALEQDRTRALGVELAEERDRVAVHLAKRRQAEARR